MAQFTTENAAEMARKAHIARRQAEIDLQNKLASHAATAIETPDYILERLARVRKQLDRLDKMILSEDDPQKLDRLISATSRLEEQERKLSGRFAPGTTKPQSPSRQQRRAIPEPVAIPPVVGDAS